MTPRRLPPNQTHTGALVRGAQQPTPGFLNVKLPFFFSFSKEKKEKVFFFFFKWKRFVFVLFFFGGIFNMSRSCRRKCHDWIWERNVSVTIRLWNMPVYLLFLGKIRLRNGFFFIFFKQKLSRVVYVSLFRCFRCIFLIIWIWRIKTNQKVISPLALDVDISINLKTSFLFYSIYLFKIVFYLHIIVSGRKK